MERAQLGLDRGDVLENVERLVDGHLEDVGDGVPAELHLLHLARVARAMAYLARHVDVRQKLHLDLDDPVALTVLAPPALHVEAEPAGLVAAHLRLGQARKQVADVREHAGVRRRVAAWRAPDRRLVDVDRLVQAVQPFDRVVRPRPFLGPIEVLRHLPAKDVRDQRRLARSADARHRDERAQRKRRVDVLQVVRARAAHHQLLAVALPSLRRHRDHAVTAQVGGGQRIGVAQDLLHRTDRDDLAAMLAGRRSDVDHEIRRADRLLVVLDHDERVAEVAQAEQCVDQTLVVALVQPDRWLVEDVQHAHQLRADLRREPDALRLAAAQRVGGAVDGQVVEADVDHELQALSDLLQNLPRDELLAFSQVETVEERDRRADRQLGNVRDVSAGHRHGQGLGLEPASVARGTRLVRHVALELGLQVLRLRLLVTPLQVGDHTLERRLVPARVAVLVLVAEPDLLVPRAVQQDVALLLGQLRPRLVHVDAEVLADRLEQLRVEELRLAPCRDRAVAQRQRRVGHHQVAIDHELKADAGADRAGPVRVVEGEVAGFGLGHAEPVDRTHEVLRHGDVGAAIDRRDDDRSVAQLGRRLQRVDQPCPLVRPDHDPVDHDFDVVLLVLVHRDRLADLVQAAIHPHPDET